MKNKRDLLFGTVVKLNRDEIADQSDACRTNKVGFRLSTKRLAVQTFRKTPVSFSYPMQ